MAAEAGSIRRNVGAITETATAPFIPFIKIAKWIISAVFFLAILGLILGGGWVTYRIIKGYNQVGSFDIAAARAGVALEKPVGLLENVIYRISPNLYAYYSNSGQYQDAFASDVEKNQQNPNLGVKIKDFKPNSQFFWENAEMTFSGVITANSLSEQIELVAYCLIEDYNKGKLIPASLTGNPTAVGNKGLVFKDQINSQFQVDCTFPQDAAVPDKGKTRTPKTAKLVVFYEFATKGTQKIYLMDKDALLSLKGEDAFKVYKISDPQLTSERKIKSKTTDGPINLAFGIDLPQPFTQDTTYKLSIQLSNNLGWRGSLEKVDEVIMQLPAVGDVEISLIGEEGTSGVQSSACDFEYIGPGDTGFKLYQVKPEKLAQVNKDCSEATLSSLDLSRKDCVSFFKERPTFSCFVKPVKVPQSGPPLYDILRAETIYIYRVDQSAATEVRKFTSGQVTEV